MLIAQKMNFKMNKNFDSQLLMEWFESLDKENYVYKEPILDQETVKVIKIACDCFKQDIHVFVTSIGILEDYIRIKSKRKEKLKNEALILVTSILISNKWTGVENDIKLNHIIAFLGKLTSQRFSFSDVVTIEMEILETINCRLPLSTRVDDLNTTIELYMQESRLKASVAPLALNILKLLYLHQNVWFKELKMIYSQNKESFMVFKSLVCNKYYIPVSILITCLRLTNYQQVLNVEAIMYDISCYTKIHTDHLNTFVKIIVKIIEYS